MQVLSTLLPAAVRQTAASYPGGALHFLTALPPAAQAAAFAAHVHAGGHFRSADLGHLRGGATTAIRLARLLALPAAPLRQLDLTDAALGTPGVHALVPVLTVHSQTLQARAFVAATLCWHHACCSLHRTSSLQRSRGVSTDL